MTLSYRIIHLPTVTSTMDEIAKRASDGAPEGLVVLADEQVAGRGRAGRTWQAPAGSSVLASVLLRPAVPLARLTTLPLIAGLAVAETLDAVAGVRCALKWPNDVWIDSRKVAGILVTSASSVAGVDHAIVGIGINLTTDRPDLPNGATSLLLATGTRYDPRTVLDPLLECFASRYAAFVERRGRPDLAAWKDRAAMLDQIVAVRQDGADILGRLVGVDEDGALLLSPRDGATIRIVAGELVRGPIATRSLPSETDLPLSRAPGKAAADRGR